MYIHPLFEGPFLAAEEMSFHRLAACMGFEFQHLYYSHVNSVDPDPAALKAIETSWRPEPPAEYFHLAAVFIEDPGDVAADVIACFVRPASAFAQALWMFVEQYQQGGIHDTELGLRFATVTTANRIRNAQSFSQCQHWTLSQWSNAIAGEVGEVCNLTKKIDRGDFSEGNVREKLSLEIADVFLYLDLLAQAARINLPLAIIRKFNIVSHRVGSDVRINLNRNNYSIEEGGWS